jgi:hypothetical protein
MVAHAGTSPEVGGVVGLTSGRLTVSGSTDAGSTPGRIGIDLVYANGGGGVYDVWPCTLDTTLPQLGWNSSGRWDGRRTFDASHPRWGAIAQVRLEMYPNECGHYDPWSGKGGGVHVQRTPADGADWLHVGNVPLPRAANGAFEARGRLVASTPLPDRRVEFDVFQVDYAYPDTELRTNLPVTRRSSTGAEVLAFANSTNRRNTWTGHWAWPGKYIVFIRDLGPDLQLNTADDRHVHGFTELYPGRVPTFDLDAVCFGLDTCVYDRGAPAGITGGFHPVTPSRLIDTRGGRGLPGAVPVGDGRSANPNAIIRRLTRAQHEMVVLGRNGVPRSGVAAVVLNVTAIDTRWPGSLSVIPRPQQAELFDDQGTFGRVVNTSNMNLSAGTTQAQLVIARVGAGGVIRFANQSGPLHLAADVVGWIDAAGGSTKGSGLVPVSRSTLFDTTLRGTPLAVDTPTRVKVAGVASVPSDATAVVLELSAAEATSGGYVAVWPGASRRPDVSHLNLQRGERRSNTVIVPVARDGTVDVMVVGSTAHIRIDVVGAFRRSQSPTTVVDPQRVVDSREGLGIPATPLQPGGSSVITLPTRLVPRAATSVWLQVTVIDPTATGEMRLWGSGQTEPATPVLSFTNGRTTSQLILVTPDPQGRVRLGVRGGAAHVALDVMGYTR